jgi:putative transposase
MTLPPAHSLLWSGNPACRVFYSIDRGISHCAQRSAFCGAQRNPLSPSAMVDTRYRKNAGAVFTLKYHLVFCPKYRKVILGGELKKRLEKLLREKAAELNAEIHALEVMPDHVHLFVETDPTLAPAHIAAQFKGYTSRVLREEFEWLRRMPSLWSRSYYIGSVGSVSEAAIKRYIEGQKS